MSSASWLLFTGAPARCVVLRVRCPGPPGSCSPVCPLGVLFCVCGVVGLLASVHRCAHSVCCFACAVSWASWLLSTGAPARCVVLRVRCPGPPGSCSPVRPLCVLCGVLLCGASLRGAHSSIRTAAVRSRQGLGTLRTHTRPSRPRLFVAGRGWVPSGRALVHPDGGCSEPAGAGYPPGAHSSIRTAAGVRVLALCGRVGRAGLPGALWCASPFPLAALSFCFAWPPPGCGGPPLPRCCCRSLLPCAPLFFFFSSPLARPRCPRLSPFSGSSCPGPWRCVLVVLLGPSLPGSPCALASFVSPAWPLAALRWFLPPPPPPLLCLAVFVASAGCLGVFFLSSSSSMRARCLWLSLVSGPGCPGPRRCALFALLAFRFSALRALSPLSCFPPGRSLLPGGCCPPPPFPLCLAVFVAAAPCCVPCAVLCCVSLGAVLRRAAARCVARCCAVVCCVALLRSFGAAACCAVPSGAARRPGALCSAALCFAVFPRAVCSVLCVFCRGAVVRAVVRRSALCCVCPGVLCCAFPVLSALCGAVLRCAGALALCCSCGACCCWRLVLWCAAVCCAVSFGVPWCGTGSGGPWFSAVGAFRCRCPCLAAWSASLWLVWFAVVPCFPVSCSVVLCCRLVLCSCALLSCCGAVGACFALLWPVVLCCVVLLVGCAVLVPGGGVCVLWCSFTRAVRSLSSPLCALRCLAVLAVVSCLPVLCAVALCCRVVLCCRALLSLCGAVCVCFALLRPVVRRRAVLCCAVGCLCCFLPGGGVCVLWCPFPPCRHAQKKTSIILHVTPRWWPCRGWHALVVAVSWT